MLASNDFLDGIIGEAVLINGKAAMVCFKNSRRNV